MHAGLTAVVISDGHQRVAGHPAAPLEIQLQCQLQLSWRVAGVNVSSCFSEDFTDYINYWKHNGYWFFDSPEIITIVAREHSIPIGNIPVLL
jgi:hypothetical protein